VTDDRGRFSIPAGTGPFVVRTSNGFFFDVVTGARISVGPREGTMQILVPGPGEFAVTPISAMQFELALRDIQDGVFVLPAIARTTAAIAEAFKVRINGDDVTFDAIKTIPTDVTDERHAERPLDAGKLYGAILAGLSQIAKNRDDENRTDFNGNVGTITSVEVTAALVRDLRDGSIDGVDASQNPTVRILLGDTNVPLVRVGTPFGTDLARAIIEVIRSGRVPALSPADGEAIQATLEGTGPTLDETIPEIRRVTSLYDGGDDAPDLIHQTGGERHQIGPLHRLAHQVADGRVAGAGGRLA